MKSPKNETIKGVGALVAMGALSAGLFVAAERADDQHKLMIAAEKARIESLIRRDVSVRVRDQVLQVSGSYVGPGIGLNVDNGFGPSMWTLGQTPAKLSFTAETLDVPPVVFQIIVNTSGQAQETLDRIVEDTKSGSTVKILRGVEHQPGTLFVNPGDISVE